MIKVNKKINFKKDSDHYSENKNISFYLKKIFSHLKIRESAGKYGVVAAYIIIIIVLSILSPAFLTLSNILNVLRQVSIIGILSIGVTFVILVGGIDLGLGSYVSFTGCILALLAQMNGFPFPIALSLIIAIFAGLLIGLFNGFVVTKGGVASFIVTLGMLTVIRGTALMITSGRPVAITDPFLIFIGGGIVFGIPFPIILLFIMFIISYTILSKTKIGRYIYAVGGNEVAARASGININRIKLFAFTICGLFSGISGVLLASRLTTGHPSVGVGFELSAIAAVIVGGTSLAGGIGGVPGTILGVLLIGTINNGLDLLNVSPYAQQMVRGAIIIGAVLMDRKSAAM